MKIADKPPTAVSTHFAFGKNWASYSELIDEERIQEAIRGLSRLFGKEPPPNFTFLDIGCGSGLHALAAIRLGAAQVTALDIDADSVATAKALLGTYAASDRWQVARKSILEITAEELGKYDVVYSWGVLHHTGAMRSALLRSAALVKEDGLLVVALYRKTPFCGIWRHIKQWYCRAGVGGQRAAQTAYVVLLRLALLVQGRSYSDYVGQYKRSRGMEFRHDLHDWLGGYPYESIEPAELRQLLLEQGFREVRSFTRPVAAFGLFGSHCDEFVFAKVPKKHARDSSLLRVLAVSYAFPPALLPQAIQIGRLLSRFPGEIGVVCGGGGDRSGERDAMPELDKRLAFRLDVTYRPWLPARAATFARRFLPFYGRIPDEFRSWVPAAEQSLRAKLAELDFRPDVIMTFGEPMSDHLLGLRLKRRLMVPWIAHFSDPWADMSFRRFNVLANVVNRKLEADVIAAADTIIFTSLETEALVMRKYPAGLRTKCRVLPHSFDEKLYPEAVEPNHGLVVRYVGNFYGHRTPFPLLSAIKKILSENPQVLEGVRFELVGQMAGWMRWHPSFRGLPERILRVVGQVPYFQSLRMMKESDLLVVIDGADDLSVFLPSKLIEYIGCGVPICGIVPPGTSAKLLGRLGAPVADPKDMPAIIVALKQGLDIARRRHAGQERAMWGSPSVRQEFAIERISREFQAIVGELVAH